jgi:tRNA threonylcarbamoyladenosine biosynthesis protein TsaB
VLQAGRGRLVVAWYQNVDSEWQRRSDYVLLGPADLIARLQEPTLLCGEIDTALAEALRAEAPGRAILLSPAFGVRRAGYLAELAWNRFVAGERDDPVTLNPIYLQSV